MVVMNRSSTERCKCVVCGKVEGNSLIYKENGIEIKMPLCHKCMEIRSKRFNEKIKAIMQTRLKQIKFDIKSELKIFNTDK